MKRTLMLFLLAALAQAHAQTGAPQTIVYQTASNAVAAGTARLRVTEVEPNGYAIDLAIVAPNPSRHTGHVQGYATRQLDRPPLCTLVIELDDARAKVLSEEGCAPFHGAGASFIEQGSALVPSTHT
jgi:hypothetical protein